jgi:nitric oxide reductase NorE protein
LVAALTDGAEAETAAVPARRMPGETGIWVLVGGDLVVFSIFFVLLLLQRSNDTAAFLDSQRALNQYMGGLNTFLLLTSSLCVALAVRSIRANPTPTPFASRCFAAAAALGLGFVGVKAFEWSERFVAGQSISSNDFFMYYFMYTGIHLLHVVVGLGVLTLLFFVSRRPTLDPGSVPMIEAGGVFWHLVDLLWIILFALFYLVK